MQRLSVTMAQAAEASGLSVRKLYELIAEGRLKSLTVGRRRLVSWASLEALLTDKTAK